MKIDLYRFNNIFEKRSFDYLLYKKFYLHMYKN